MNNLKKLQKELRVIVVDTEKEVENFKKDLDKNAGSALRWSYGLFDLVALSQEAQYVLEAIARSKTLTIEKIADYLKNEVLSEAKFPSRSTSPTHNLWEESVLSAKAKILDKVLGKL
jgi:hypothetical protein